MLSLSSRNIGSVIPRLITQWPTTAAAEPIARRVLMTAVSTDEDLSNTNRSSCSASTLNHAECAADYSEYEACYEAAPDYQAEDSHREDDNAADCAIAQDHQDRADDQDQPNDYPEDKCDVTGSSGTCRQWTRVPVDLADPEEDVRPEK